MTFWWQFIIKKIIDLGSAVALVSVLEANIEHQALERFFRAKIDVAVVQEQRTTKTDFFVQRIASFQNMTFAISAAAYEVRVR